MRIIKYKQFLEILDALDAHTKCKYTKKALLKMIFDHYIQLGPFVISNSKASKALYYRDTREQVEDFVTFMNAKNLNYGKTNTKGKAERGLYFRPEYKT